jgi:hypothetical protein
MAGSPQLFNHLFGWAAMKPDSTNQGSKWVATEGDHDAGGRPQVFCRSGDREYCFCQGRRYDKPVWLCYRRRRLLFNHVLEEVGRCEAEEAATAAENLLRSIQPTFDILFSAEARG